MLFAHERWFELEPVTSDWGFITETATLLLLIGAVALTLLVRLIARFWPGVDIPFLARLVPWMPFALRLHLAVSMVGLLSLGYYLSPSMDLPKEWWSFLFGAVMVIVAVTMAAGWYAREGAALLVVAGPLGMIPFGVVPVLSRLDLLGLAVYILIAGPGRWSADVETARTAPTAPSKHASSIFWLKLLAGLALIVVAFDEKLVHPQLAVEFLSDHPNFNVVQSVLGIEMSPLEFTRLAAAVEVLFGLLLISGALPQLIVLAAALPFNATLWYFGTNELVGHLPIYATLLAVLVYGSSPQFRPAVSALLPAYWRTSEPTRPSRSYRPATPSTGVPTASTAAITSSDPTRPSLRSPPASSVRT